MQTNNELTMEFFANTDEITHLNLTNVNLLVVDTKHAFWNLEGAGNDSILDHFLHLNCKEFIPVDEQLIPIGELMPVEGTPMDFTSKDKMHTIGERIEKVTGGYDHCYVVNRVRITKF